MDFITVLVWTKEKKIYTQNIKQTKFRNTVTYRQINGVH